MNLPKRRIRIQVLVVSSVMVIGPLALLACTDKRHDCTWLASCPIPSAEESGTAGAPTDACRGQCAAPTAVCRSATGTCVECSSNDQCSTDKPYCDAVAGKCHECLSDGQCGTTEPLCDPSSKSCVECLSNVDCKSASASRCDEFTHRCVACRADADCKQITGKGLCLLGSTTSDTSGQAGASNQGGMAGRAGLELPIAPNAGRAGSNPTSASSAGADQGGSSSPASGTAGQTATALPGTAPGECVECTGKNPSACGTSNGKALVCDSQRHQCTTYAASSAGLCQKCVSDAQCKAGMLCYQQTFDGAAVGYFCFNKQNTLNGGTPGDCTAVANRPYVKVQPNAVSIDDEVATLCTLRATTCKALLEFGSIECGTGVANDQACGFAPGVDSKCVAWGGLQYLCTTSCMTNDDCITGSTCDTGVSPRICSVQ